MPLLIAHNTDFCGIMELRLIFFLEQAARVDGFLGVVQVTWRRGLVHATEFASLSLCALIPARCVLRAAIADR
jgi:hypothetical protein